jgi:hypothetical protein
VTFGAQSIVGFNDVEDNVGTFTDLGGENVE